MKLTLSQIALLVLLSPAAVCQTSQSVSDCSTLKHLRRKVSSLSGVVAVCSGDVCGDPSTYDLDDDITVELRSKRGAILDAQKVLFEVSQKQGTRQDGTPTTFKQKERTFSFENKPDGDYLLVFSLYKNRIAQPAGIFPTNYSQKRDGRVKSYYVVEPTCPR